MTIKELYQWAVENEVENSEIKICAPYHYMDGGFWETDYEYEEIDDVDTSWNEKDEIEIILHY